jgi:hypothetical protein
MWEEIKGTWRQGWPIILVPVVIAIVITAMNLREAVRIYPTRMQLTTVQTAGDDNANVNRLNGIAGLAQLAGATLPTNQNALQFRLFIESLYSRDIADEIAKNQDIMKTLFANQWNATTQSWEQPPLTFTEKAINEVRALLGLAPPAQWHPPNGINLLSFLNDYLLVDQDPRKPYLVKLTLLHYNSQFAINFLNYLTATVDNQLRQKALVRANQYMDYISRKLPTVTIAEHRAALTQALGEQERFAMVASSSLPFAADVFEKPWTSTLPDSPKPRQAFLLALVIGGAIGFAIAFGVRKVRGRFARRPRLDPYPAE